MNVETFMAAVMIAGFSLSFAFLERVRRLSIKLRSIEVPLAFSSENNHAAFAEKCHSANKR